MHKLVINNSHACSQAGRRAAGPDFVCLQIRRVRFSVLGLRHLLAKYYAAVVLPQSETGDRQSPAAPRR